MHPYLLEEAHEAAAAIDRGEWDDIASELGDLLYLVAFVSGLAEEAKAFVVLLADPLGRRLRRHDPTGAATSWSWGRAPLGSWPPWPPGAWLGRTAPAVRRPAQHWMWCS